MLNTFIKQKRFVVVLSHEIFVYNFADLKLDQHIETCSNPKGLNEMKKKQNFSTIFLKFF